MSQVASATELVACRLPSTLAKRVNHTHVPFIPKTIIATGKEEEIKQVLAKSDYFAYRCQEMYEDVKAAYVGEGLAFRFCAVRAQNIIFFCEAAMQPLILFQNVAMERKPGSFMSRVSSTMVEKKAIPENYVRYSGSRQDTSDFQAVCKKKNLQVVMRSHPKDSTIAADLLATPEEVASLVRVGYVMKMADILTSKNESAQATIKIRDGEVKTMQAALKAAEKNGAGIFIKHLSFRVSCSDSAALERLITTFDEINLKPLLNIIRDTAPPKQAQLQTWTGPTFVAPPTHQKSWTIGSADPTPLSRFAEVAKALGATIDDRFPTFFNARIKWMEGTIIPTIRDDEDFIDVGTRWPQHKGFVLRVTRF